LDQPVLARFVAQERQAFAHHFRFVARDRTPDREAVGEFRHHVDEAFHRQAALEVDRGERGEDLVPAAVAGAGRAAVAFRQMDGLEALARRENGERRALLFNVHVIGAEMDEHVVGADALDQRRRLRAGAENMRLVAVDGLDAEQL
jgi:hypothetical protein